MGVVRRIYESLEQQHAVRLRLRIHVARAWFAFVGELKAVVGAVTTRVRAMIQIPQISSIKALLPVTCKPKRPQGAEVDFKLRSR